MVQKISFSISKLFISGIFFIQLFLSFSSYLYAQGQITSKSPLEFPLFWDSHNQLEKPDLKSVKSIRIVTDIDYPPITMMDQEGNPTGFAVELMRESCHLLSLKCNIQIRPFENILTTLDNRKADVVLSAFQPTNERRNRYSMTLPYFRNPGRFLVRKENRKLWLSVDNRNVAIVTGTVHEAFLKEFFPKAYGKGYPDFVSAVSALKDNQVDFIFADGLGLSFWLNGQHSNQCCTFYDGAYTENAYFGEGYSFTFRKEDERLKRAFDYAFQQLYLNQKYKELYWRFFSIDPYAQ